MAGFFPGEKYGGPPVSIDNFCTLMKEECYIVTCNHDKDDCKAYADIPVMTWVKRANCKVMYLSDKDYNKKKFEEIVLKIKPDIFYLQGLFQGCIFPSLQIAKKYKFNVLLATRGELCVGAFKKKYKKLPYIAWMRLNGLFQNVYFQSTSSEETVAIERYLGINEGRILELSNIPSIPDLKYEVQYKQSGSAKFVFISRIHPKKNLLGAIGYFTKVSGDICFDIYGPIEDEVYWKKCLERIKLLPKNINVNYCGTISHQKVHEILSQYDAFLFPTFSENYGHVIAEALSVGTPVIISNQTPWRNLQEKKCGWDLSLDDELGFVSVIQKIVNMDQVTIKKMRESAYDYFEKKSELEKLKNNYKECFRMIIESKI